MKPLVRTEVICQQTFLAKILCQSLKKKGDFASSSCLRDISACECSKTTEVLCAISAECWVLAHSALDEAVQVFCGICSPAELYKTVYLESLSHIALACAIRATLPLFPIVLNCH